MALSPNEIENLQRSIDELRRADMHITAHQNDHRQAPPKPRSHAVHSM